MGWLEEMRPEAKPPSGQGDRDAHAPTQREAVAGRAAARCTGYAIIFSTIPQVERLKLSRLIYSHHNALIVRCIGTPQYCRRWRARDDNWHRVGG